MRAASPYFRFPSSHLAASLRSKMKITFLIVRILLGLVFLIFGSNAFLPYFPMQPLPHTSGGEFADALFRSHYVFAIAVCQIVGELFLLIGRLVPLGLVLLGPVIANILLLHIFPDRTWLPLAIILFLLALSFSAGIIGAPLPVF